LCRWEAHLRAGVEVAPRPAVLDEGLVVALAVPLGPVDVTVACRVVDVARAPSRFGFAYGTLPHHLIEGEEAFTVERHERLVGRYLRGMQQHVAQALSGGAGTPIGP
jgi:uncharacterized protein (UPF0548 family)